MSYGVGCRCSSDLLWLWLWCRTAAVAPTRPLAWELTYASGEALKSKKKKKKERKKEKSEMVVLKMNRLEKIDTHIFIHTHIHMHRA